MLRTVPLVFSLGALLLLFGCSRATPDASPTATKPDQAPAAKVPGTGAVLVDDTEHGHKSGAHGGIMVSLGRDSYHVEAVVEKDGILRLYTLGKDETRVIDVDKQNLKGFVKIDGESSSQSFTLEPEPQEGDAPGRTSQFVGKLPKELWGMSLDVTVPNIVISGERFRLGFKSVANEHGEGMPSKVGNDEERVLYLTPGGKYTEADIVANGRVTASQKFKGLRSAHDMFPKAGDKICPITETKANPTFTWVVDGKSYEFCCPPCVDEFVKAAKLTTDELKPPSEYIKR